MPRLLRPLLRSLLRTARPPGPRSAVWLLLWLSAPGLWGAAAAQSGGTWPFDPGPDRFEPAALLDLSALNEPEAGITGFVRRSPDGAGFVRGDGQPIRFWAVNTTVQERAPEALRDHARFLAKRGVNMVRFHGQLPQAGAEGGALGSIDTAERDRLWQLVAAMRAKGIYVTLSLYYPHAVRSEAAQRWSVPEDSPGLTGLIYFDPVLQDAYKGWLRDTLIPVNPYTGRALREDPALAILQMQNEDSLLFWTLNTLRGREARLLADRFGAFAVAKYGTAEAARRAWGGAVAPDPIGGIADDWAGGRLALAALWHLTGANARGAGNPRLADQTEFLTRTMRDWHAEIARFLREDIGAPQLFNAGNWRTADTAVLDDAERHAQTAGDVIGVNRYVTNLHEGTRKGWAIVAGDLYREEGILHRPLDLPVALRQPAGHPYIIPETLWVPPIWQQAEGPILMAAWQALTGVDISYWFSASRPQWRAPQSANGYLPSIGKWVTNTPQILGGFPAAALIFRQGLIDEAPPAVIEHRPLDDLWQRRAPRVLGQQGRDPNRDTFRARLSGLFGGDEDWLAYAFLAGPVQMVTGSAAPDVLHPDLARRIDLPGRRVTSLTGQLHWDWGRGLVTLRAPRAQGAVGALGQAGRLDLGDVTLTSGADYAAVVVVPLDQLPIAQSRRLLVQIGAVARPTGWAARPATHEGAPAQEVTAFGGAPWQVARVSGDLAIRNPHLREAVVLDANGMARGVLPLSHRDGAAELRLPGDTLYLLLR